MNNKGLDMAEVAKVRAARKALLTEHKVWDDGTLCNYFGKFERQPFYAIYFYEQMMNGDGTDIFGCPFHVDDECECEYPIPTRIDLTPEEVYVFHELRCQGDVPVAVRLDQSDQGFVYLSLIYATKEATMSEQEEKQVPITESLKEIKAELEEAFDVLSCWGGIEFDAQDFSDVEETAAGIRGPQEAIQFLIASAQEPIDKLQALIDSLSK